MSINLNFLSGTSNTLSIDEIMKCLGEAGGEPMNKTIYSYIDIISLCLKSVSIQTVVC